MYPNDIFLPECSVVTNCQTCDFPEHEEDLTLDCLECHTGFSVSPNQSFCHGKGDLWQFGWVTLDNL